MSAFMHMTKSNEAAGAERIDSNNNQVFRVAEAAQLLVTTEDCVRDLLRTGQLKGFKLGTRWRVTQSAIDAFINNGGSNGNRLA